jgi:hypothetical protein
MVSPVRHYLLLAGNPQCLLHEANLSCYFVDLCVCVCMCIYICIYPFGIDTARQRRLSMHFPKVQMQIGMMVCTWENTGI